MNRCKSIKLPAEKSQWEMGWNEWRAAVAGQWSSRGSAVGQLGERERALQQCTTETAAQAQSIEVPRSKQCAVLLLLVQSRGKLFIVRKGSISSHPAGMWPITTAGFQAAEMGSRRKAD